MKPIYLAALLLAACAAHPADSAPDMREQPTVPMQAGQHSLEGKWSITRIGTTRLNTTGVLHFKGSDRSFSANLGCNTLFGTFSQSGNLLQTGESATTLIACPQAIQAQEAMLAASLAQTASYRISGNKLELLDNNGNIVLQAEHQPPATR